MPGNAFLGVNSDELLPLLHDHLTEERLQALMAEGATWSEEQGFEEAFASC